MEVNTKKYAAGAFIGAQVKQLTIEVAQECIAEKEREERESKEIVADIMSDIITEVVKKQE